MALIRVLIVDDSVLIREALREGLRPDAGIEIVGTASSGEDALLLLQELRPNMVTLDLALPGMSGLATLEEIRKTHPSLPVILFSTFSPPMTGTRLDAPDRGPTEYVQKPAQLGSSPEVRRRFSDNLVSRIKALCLPALLERPAAVVTCARSSGGAQVDVVALGASTGGPEALAEMIPQFPADFPVPILIVQHMPANFTRDLAERLNTLTPLSVAEGRAGCRLRPEQVWIAPGDYHMTVMRQGTDVLLMTNRQAPEQGCRPSVDVLFRSVAAVFKTHVLGVVLTGMGADGTSGAQAIWDSGGEVIVQDEATSAIWGMPGRVVAAGLARTVCPLGSVPFAIMSRVYASRHQAEPARAVVVR